MEESSESLLRRAATGDERALEGLIRLHEPRLLAFVRARAGAALRARESVRDLLQEILIELVRGLGTVQYHGEPEFRAWLYSLAERRITDRARHHGREKRGARLTRSIDDSGAGEELLLEGYSSVFSPAHALQRKEEVERLEQAFAQLAPGEREVLSLAYFCGMNSTEIGAELGITADTARKRKNRAKTRLAALWDGDVGPS